MERANPHAGLVGSPTPAEFEDLSDAVEERRLREELGFGTLAEAAEPYRPDPACPECGEGGARRDGASASGLQRWRCRACGTRFTSLTGTVLENCKKPLAPGCPSSGWRCSRRRSTRAPRHAASATRQPGSGATACSPC